MKSLSHAFFLLIGFFAISSCSSVPKNNAENANLHRKWMLTEYKNFSKEELTNLNAYMDLTENPEQQNQYSAKMGCNGMGFTAKFKNDGSAEFSQAISTMMYCDGRMDVETAFGKDLPTITQYKVDGHYLILSNENVTMKFVAEDWD